MYEKYSNGSLRFREYWVKGERHGTCIWLDRSGKITRFATYVHHYGFSGFHGIASWGSVSDEEKDMYYNQGFGLGNKAEYCRLIRDGGLGIAELLELPEKGIGVIIAEYAETMRAPAPVHAPTHAPAPTPS